MYDSYVFRYPFEGVMVPVVRSLNTTQYEGFYETCSIMYSDQGFKGSFPCEVLYRTYPMVQKRELRKINGEEYYVELFSNPKDKTLELWASTIRNSTRNILQKISSRDWDPL